MVDTTKPRAPSSALAGRGEPIIALRHPAGAIRVVLGRAPIVIGRGEAADVTIDNDGLSREHAKLVPARDGVVQLVDLESTNGTFVNGARIEALALREHDQLLLGPDVRGRLLYAEPGDDPRGPLARLTSRQLRVACLVSDGLTSQEIADQLELSVRTIDSHLARIFGRLQIRGRADLARLVTEAGLSFARD